MGSRRGPGRSLRRRKPVLDPRPRILVVCEGELTEPSYIDAFKRIEENKLVNVIVDDVGGSPKTLVERAAESKKQSERRAKRAEDANLKYDEVWCVFDVDEHPRLPEAKQQARDNNIRLAISNPCFELWVLLHFQNQTAYIGRDVVQRSCRTHLPKFEKEVPFNSLRSAYPDAVRRAMALEKMHADNETSDDNPSTTVYKLTERIRELGKARQLRLIPVSRTL